jgi:uncharacterized NAD(P)/FAD-binding protein YdhS
MQSQSHGVASSPGVPVPDPPTIAIVGAGFSGTALAIHLLRQRAATPLHIVLVDPRTEIGAGVAYATRDYPYPLNVAAGHMSLDSARPRDFLDYLCDQGIHAEPGDYLPRQVFGGYVREQFRIASANAPTGVSCTHVAARALQLRRRAGGGFELWLDNGTAVRADEVVLALGNAPPAVPPQCAALAGQPRFINDPETFDSRIGQLQGEPLESVLLIGSGLTMIDAALRLAALRPRVRHIHVLSRHGLLPCAQATEQRPPRNPPVERKLAESGSSVRKLVRNLGRLMQENHAAGGDWREVIALARPHLAASWRGLDAVQRSRFLRHVRPLWDVHRHRVPEGPLNAVRTLQRLSVLQVHAGRLEELTPVEDAIEVQWRPRGADKSRAWLVDLVVNCTGPDARADRRDDPLVQSLLANGFLRRDAHALGIEVAPDGRVLNSSGAPVDHLHYIGPWLRARDWEATAVPELREQAAALARKIAQPPPAARPVVI